MPHVRSLYERHREPSATTCYINGVEVSYDLCATEGGERSGYVYLGFGVIAKINGKEQDGDEQLYFYKHRTKTRVK